VTLWGWVVFFELCIFWLWLYLQPMLSRLQSKSWPCTILQSCYPWPSWVALKITPGWDYSRTEVWSNQDCGIMWFGSSSSLTISLPSPTSFIASIKNLYHSPAVSNFNLGLYLPPLLSLQFAQNPFYYFAHLFWDQGWFYLYSVFNKPRHLCYVLFSQGLSLSSFFPLRYLFCFLLLYSLISMLYSLYFALLCQSQVGCQFGPQCLVKQ